MRDFLEILRCPECYNSLYLEIGCGPMILGLHMARRGHKVVGIDSSFELAREILARRFQSIESSNSPGALFICADVKKMTLADDSIDLIYGGGVIEDFDNLKRSVSEL